MPKCCFENFPSLKSSKARLIILNISFKIQLYRPNKHLYDTLVTTSSLQCKNILKNFVVDEKTAKIQQQEKSRSLSFSYPEPFLRAVRRGALAKSKTGNHKNMVKDIYVIRTITFVVANQMPV